MWMSLIENHEPEQNLMADRYINTKIYVEEVQNAEISQKNKFLDDMKLKSVETTVFLVFSEVTLVGNLYHLFCRLR